MDNEASVIEKQNSPPKRGRRIKRSQTEKYDGNIKSDNINNKI